jgi:hypothetical protein
MLKTKLNSCFVSEICFETNSVFVYAIEAHVDPARGLIDFIQFTPRHSTTRWHGAKNGARTSISGQRNKRVRRSRRDKHSDVLLWCADTDIKGAPRSVVSLAASCQQDTTDGLLDRIYKYWLAGTTSGPGASADNELAIKASNIPIVV